MNIEQKEGYTIIDRRGGEPCRCCCCPTDCHTQEYGKPTLDCVHWLRSEVKRLEDENRKLRRQAKVSV